MSITALKAPAMQTRAPKALRRHLWVEIILVTLIILAITFSVQLTLDPSYTTMGSDSSLFAYCGKIIADGGLMYRDCYDHKTPGVYYLDALAFLLGGGRLWVLWLFQCIWVSITALVFFLTIRRIWGRFASWITSFIFLLTLLHPYYYNGGNYTEIYALIFIILTIGALYSFLLDGRSAWLFLIGLLTAGGFLLKPTYITMGMASGAVILYLMVIRRNWRGLARSITLILAGLILPLALVAGYWVIRGGFSDFMFANLNHNILYVEQGHSLRGVFKTIQYFWTRMPFASITWLAGVGFLTFAICSWRKIFPSPKSKPDSPGHIYPASMRVEQAQVYLMFALLLAILVDAFLIAIPNQNFHHYFVIPLVSMTASSGYLFYSFQDAFHRGEGQVAISLPLLAVVVVILIPWSCEIIRNELPDASDLQKATDLSNTLSVHPNDLEQYIIDHSTPDQTILVWGYDASIYLVTGRRSPSRYVFPMHFLTIPMPGNNGFPEFMRDIQEDPPELILSNKRSLNKIPHLGLEEQELVEQCQGCTDEIKRQVIGLKQYVSEYYMPVRTDFEEWQVYHRCRTGIGMSPRHRAPASLPPLYTLSLGIVNPMVAVGLEQCHELRIARAATWAEASRRLAPPAGVPDVLIFDLTDASAGKDTACEGHILPLLLKNPGLLLIGLDAGGGNIQVKAQ
jgi:hypothetical protein